MTHRQALAVIVLLVVITLELALIGVKVPTPSSSAAALQSAEYYLNDIRDDVDRMALYVTEISQGRCSNPKICR